MKIGIITYNVPHLKTQDVIFKLLESNYKIKLFLTKFKNFKKKKTLYSNIDPYNLRDQTHMIYQKN